MTLCKKPHPTKASTGCIFEKGHTITYHETETGLQYTDAEIETAARIGRQAERTETDGDKRSAGAGKVYISGRIAGLDEQTTRRLFAATAGHVAALGHEPLNPFDVEPVAFEGDTEPWEGFMRGDIAAMLTQCDRILMLKNWQASKGARLELHVALTCGLKLVTLEELAS